MIAGPDPILALADGTVWRISAHDEAAAPTVSAVSAAMQATASDRAATHRLIVVANGALPGPSHGTEENICCRVVATTNPDLFTIQMMRVAEALARQVELGGGLLLHGALAELRGQGGILAGPGGVGKTTASRRLPTPWRAHSDDAALIVRDRQGCYWAHPWPTWSRFLLGGPGGSWDVQQAVPLRGLFFLSRSPLDALERIGPGRAAILLAAVAEQAASDLMREMTRDAARAIRLRRWESVCALARAIPACVLHLSQLGPFWRQLEQALD